MRNRKIRTWRQLKPRQKSDYALVAQSIRYLWNHDTEPLIRRFFDGMTREISGQFELGVVQAERLFDVFQRCEFTPPQVVPYVLSQMMENPDAGNGMLLTELLDESTLEWLGKRS